MKDKISNQEYDKMIERTVALLFSVQDDKGVPFAITSNLKSIADFWDISLTGEYSPTNGWGKTPKQIVEEIWIKFDAVTQNQENTPQEKEKLKQDNQFYNYKWLNTNQTKQTKWTFNEQNCAL